MSGIIDSREVSQEEWEAHCKKLAEAAKPAAKKKAAKKAAKETKKE